MKKRKKRSIHSLIQLLGYLRRHKLMLLFISISVICANVLALVVPKITGDVVDLMAGGSENIKKIIAGALQIVVYSSIVWFISSIQNGLLTKLANSMVYELRQDVMRKIEKLPVSYFDNNTKGNIISIVSTDISNISDTISGDVVTLLTGVVTVTGSFIMMVKTSGYLTAVFSICIPVLIIGTKIISNKSRKLYHDRKESYGNLCGYAEEMISAQKSVKVYGLEEYNYKTFSENSEELKDRAAKAEFCSSLMMPFTNAVSDLNFVVICTIGAKLVLGGALSIGDISSFIIYSKKFSGPIVETANVINMLQVALAACDRVFGILNADAEPLTLSVEDKDKDMGDERNAISIKNVTFGYTDDKTVIKNWSFDIRKGRKIAIVGSTGSGKTTIISLLLRFYNIKTGQILIDGKDVREIPLPELRNKFALMLQDSWLFEGSVMDNICYAADDKKNNPDLVKKLCKEIYVNEFIEELSDGYETILKNDSGGLSQGQKQLINIARAFLCDREIFILDEATSSVDPQTEAKIQSVTERVINGRTSIIIAHRLSTILSADCIIVMRNGEIIETGNHNELMQKGGYYKNLYESQFAS